MEDGKQGKRDRSLCLKLPNILERNWKTCGLFLQTYTYYQDKKGRCPLYLPSARPTGNRPELVPTHLEKTFFKGTVRDKLDQDKQVPKLCQSSKSMFIPVNCPKIHPEKKSQMHKQKSLHLLFLKQ